MKNKKAMAPQVKSRFLIILICFIALILCLSGCQLAQESSVADDQNARLVGVFITAQHLALPDAESYIYATVTSGSYDFSGIDGIQFFAVEAPSKNEISSVLTDGITHPKFGTHTNDGENRLTLEGTVYLFPQDGSIQYINPVYQKDSGEIYVAQGQGISMPEAQSEGTSSSQKLEESTTVTENGKSTKKSTTVEITIETMLPPQKIVVLEMDTHSNALSRKEYAPGKLPESISPDSATDFIILESHKSGKIQRTIQNRGDGSLYSFYQSEKSIIMEQLTLVNW